MGPRVRRNIYGRSSRAPILVMKILRGVGDSPLDAILRITAALE
jgi:hypothetical protein